MELGVGAHEYSLTCQILIGWKHHAICWLVWQESACDTFLLIGRALGWWAWSAHDHCMHFVRENAGELGVTESTLFWQLRANYMQKKCPTPQPVAYLRCVVDFFWWMLEVENLHIRNFTHFRGTVHIYCFPTWGIFTGLLSIITPSAVQSFAWIWIHNTIVFINTSTPLRTTKVVR